MCVPHWLQITSTKHPALNHSFQPYGKTRSDVVRKLRPSSSPLAWNRRSRQRSAGARSPDRQVADTRLLGDDGWASDTSPQCAHLNKGPDRAHLFLRIRDNISV